MGSVGVAVPVFDASCACVGRTQSGMYRHLVMNATALCTAESCVAVVASTGYWTVTSATALAPLVNVNAVTSFSQVSAPMAMAVLSLAMNAASVSEPRAVSFIVSLVVTLT